jgi:hypothetical protein
MTEPGSIQSSLAYLQRQRWWRKFRAGRRHVPLLDDALWLGHYCRWLHEHHVAIEACTSVQLDAYLATLTSFRPGPRAACERTVQALMAFVSEPSTPVAA